MSHSFQSKAQVERSPDEIKPAMDKEYSDGEILSVEEHEETEKGAQSFTLPKGFVIPHDPYRDTVIDLHDISLLINYERGSTDPKFRHAKLREVATVGEFTTIIMPAPVWTNAAVPRTGLVYERRRPKPRPREEEEPDLPSNMLIQPVPPALRSLKSKQLETYYWQARNHDGCFKTVAIFQHLIDLLSEFINVRIRTVENDKPHVYTTYACQRRIMEFNLFQQTTLTLAAVLPDNQTYVSGGTPVVQHAVLGFIPEGEGIDTILDLSSLQFGDVGRGFKGRGTFVLESLEEYISRLNKYAKANSFEDAKQSHRIRHDAPDTEWLIEVAQKVKERWENRESVPWCGHCGAPPRGHAGQGLLMCSKCRQAYYCDAEHQRAAWSFHKHFCGTSETAK